MKILVDTHLLLWAAEEHKRLPAAARRQMKEADLVFSVVSLWEIAIKRKLGRKDFSVDLRILRRGLLDNNYSELQVTGEHACATEELPMLHKDPFDRLLVAQATVEGFILLTSDPLLEQYAGPVRRV